MIYRYIFFYTRNLLGQLSCSSKEPAQQSSLAYSCLDCPGLSLSSVLSHFTELSWETSIGSFCFLLLFCFPISPGSNLWGFCVPHSVPIQPCEGQGPVSMSRRSYPCFALRDSIWLIWQSTSCSRGCPTSQITCRSELASYRHVWSFSHQPEASFTDFSGKARPTARSFEKNPIKSFIYAAVSRGKWWRLGA